MPGARRRPIRAPDLIVFDLDPGDGVAFADVVKAAHDLREQLQRLGLKSFCRTTGGKGLHLVVPLEPVADWDVVKPFCRAFAETLSQDSRNVSVHGEEGGSAGQDPDRLAAQWPWRDCRCLVQPARA